MSVHPNPSHPPRALYAPQLGELVRDLITGRVGTYMGPGYEKHPTVYLRPPRGGYEWEVPASEIEPVHDEPKLGPVTPTVRTNSQVAP
ncbi:MULTISPECIES: hypothetical protein [Kitasatospora]|uniref:hypothetical protein n=1 Tax=Kitasatospora TaxID=2063 RepID=UPI000C70E161|nr:hypothetical protein [Kitasatospora sp. GP30]MDH6144889.1 hypothetical protein [Kitasatospora sp. GP30]